MQSYASEIDWLKSKVSENSASMLYPRLADRYLQINEHERAIEYAEKGVLLHPHYATARFIMAKCYYNNSQFDEANKHLKEALAVDPEHLGALNLQCELLKRLGDLEKVKENYNLMLDIDPFNEDIHQKLYDLQYAEPAGESTEAMPESSFEPDDFLESGVSETADFLNRFEQGKEDVEETPLPDLEHDLETSLDKSLDDSIDATFPDFQSDVETAPMEPEANPFEDFNQPADEGDTEYETETRDETTTASPDEITAETDTEEAKIRDEVLDESIDDDFEIDRSKYKEEENRFTELLDNIFSSSIDEEEQAESEMRNAIERIANEDTVDTSIGPRAFDARPDEKSGNRFEPLMPSEETPTHEEQIIESGRDEQDEFYNFDVEEPAEEENSIPEEFVTREDEIDQGEAAGVDKDEGVLPNIAEEPASDEPKSDFGDFLSTLDIKEDDGLKEESMTFDDDLPSFDLDLDDELPGADVFKTDHADDDWMGPQSMDEKDESRKGGAAQSANMAAGKSEVEQPAKPPRQETDDAAEGRGKGKFYTPTLGEIYAAQGQYSKAIAVFETLIKSNPENELYRQKLDYLRKKLQEQQQRSE